MAELGFALPGELNDEGARRYRRQLDRDALLVLELDGPAYQRENLRNGNFVVRVLESVDR